MGLGFRILSIWFQGCEGFGGVRVWGLSFGV